MWAVSIAPTPARIRLPWLAEPPATILDFLTAHFPHIGSAVWQARVEAGMVRTDAGEVITLATPYESGRLVSYFREVGTELEIPFAESIVHEDEHLLVADKPHFVPVTPGGEVVNECLLFRLQRRIGNAELAPVHRLDRDTAGLVVFVKDKAHRAPYAQLFETGNVERQYQAIAHLPAEVEAGREWQVENRLEREPGGFRMRIVEGLINARTRIALKEVTKGRGRFDLLPTTGKKHQLRIHMLSLGFPVVNDPFYPELKPAVPSDFSRPMQLLACALKFQDPVTKDLVSLGTQRTLDF
jgi:tRNA pseudouridine32 synthase / 23S rRNA pseudouridine746 synthase